MSFIDESYIDKIASHFGIVKKSDGLWNCSCVFCGDSKTNKRKKRGYFHYGRIAGKATDDIIYSCRNCGISMHLMKFIEKYSPTLYSQYRLDKFRKLKTEKLVLPTKKQKPTRIFVPPKAKHSYSKISDLEHNHPARQYLASRKIEDIDRFGYTDNFSMYVDEQTNCSDEYKNVPKDKRIILPITTPSGEVVGFQGRALDDTGVRYITIKTDKELFCKVYGLDKYDKDKPGFLVEGPIDSIFLPNSISMCGSSLDLNAIEFGYINPDNLIVVFDNESRNKEIVNKMVNMAELGFRVYVPKKSLSSTSKDINKMVLDGIEINTIIESLIKNSYKGVKAKLMISDWRKV